MVQHHKNIFFLSFLLLSTSLSTSAYAACPTEVGGVITVNGSGNTSCSLSPSANTLNVTSTGSLIETGPAGAVRIPSTTATAIHNAGLIQGQGLGIFAFDHASLVSITNELGGTISSNGTGMAIRINDHSSLGSLTNAGTIANINISDSSTLGSIFNDITGVTNNITIDDTVTVTGNIINNGHIEDGLTIDESTIVGDITNNNRIWGSDTGVYINDSELDSVITNNGYIGGTNYSLYISGPATPIVFNNYGELDGAAYINDTTLNLETGSVMSGSIDGADAIVNINTNLSTVSDYGQNESLGQINIGSGKIFSTLGSNNFSAQNFNNNGTLSIIQGNVVTINGDYYQAPTATLRMQANSVNNYGQLLVNGNAILTNSALFVDVTNGASFLKNDLLNNVISATGTLDVTGLTISDNSTLFNFSTQTVGNNLNLIVAVDSGTSVEKSVKNQNNNPAEGAAKVLDQIIATTPTGDMATVKNALATLTSEADVSKAASQTLPTLAGGSTTAIMQTMNTTSQVVQARQEQNLGLSSGDDFIVSHDVWFKPFGSWSDQQTKGSVIGFDASSYGLVAGADRTLNENWKLGLAFTYASTNVDSKDKFNSLDVNSYQGTIYSSYTIDPRTEANFQLGFGYNQNDSSRTINFGGLNRIALGDFNSYSLNAGAGIARRYEIVGNTSFLPSIRMDYNRITNQSYTETGAGALNLNVESQTSDQLIPSVQFKLDHNFTDDIVVSANTGIGYDLLDSTNTATSSYVGGGSTFVTNGLRASPWTVRSGLGITYKAGDTYDITVRYDRDDRGTDFDNQSVTAKLRFSF